MNPRNVRAQAGLPPPRNIFSRVFRALATQSYLPNPDDERYFALDISEYESLSIATVAAHMNPIVRAVIVRICGSRSVKDEKFPQHWAAVREYGIPHDLYMYNWPGWTVDSHISNFMDSVERYADGDLGNIIWVDAECHADKSKREVSNHTWGCVQALERETGKRVGVYSGLWFINGYMEIQDWMSEVPWWMAQWLSGQGGEHPGPPQTIDAIPRENIYWHQTGSRCDESIFGGVDYVDTDRWCLSEEKYEQIYLGIQEELPIVADWWPTPAGILMEG